MSEGGGWVDRQVLKTFDGIWGFGERVPMKVEVVCYSCEELAEEGERK